MNLGFGEILVLLVLALLVFGPQRLPEIARSVGKAVRAFQTETQKAMGELRSSTETAGVFDRPDAPSPPARRDPPAAAPSPAPPRPGAPADAAGEGTAAPGAERSTDAGALEDT